MLPPPTKVRYPIQPRRMDADDTSPGISLEYSYHFPHGIVVSTASTRPRLDAIEAQAVEPAAADPVVAAANCRRLLLFYLQLNNAFPCC